MAEKKVKTEEKIIKINVEMEMKVSETVAVNVENDVEHELAEYERNAEEQIENLLRGLSSKDVKVTLLDVEAKYEGFNKKPVSKIFTPKIVSATGEVLK